MVLNQPPLPRLYFSAYIPKIWLNNVTSSIRECGSTLYVGLARAVQQNRNRRFLLFIYNQLLQTGFLNVILKRMLQHFVPLDTILPGIFAFIAGFSCTVWTKMRSLWANWLPIPPTAITKVRGLRKNMETSNRKTIY